MFLGKENKDSGPAPCHLCDYTGHPRARAAHRTDTVEEAIPVAPKHCISEDKNMGCRSKERGARRQGWVLGGHSPAVVPVRRTVDSSTDLFQSY